MYVLEWEAFLAKGLPAGNSSAAITVGVFDGVHRGHTALIDRILRQDALPVVITFTLKHRSKSTYPGDITSFRQKAAIFESMGVAATIVADLSDSFRRMSGAEFFRLLRERGNMGFLAVGSNFRCGHHLDTDAAMIRQLNAAEGIPSDIVATLSHNGAPISSSRIRETILQGRLQDAAAMLGRPFAVDICGAIEQTGGALSYDASVLRQILPPTGSYSVMLRSQNGDNQNGDCHHAQAHIENSLIRIQPHIHSTASGWDSIEFAG
jgi:riboflavin kinase/FMN adenylyltransferase